MMRYLRALGAGTLLLALVIGIPCLLAVTIGNPLRGWPDLAAGDLSDTALIDVLAAVAYLAWVQFAVAVVMETIEATTRIRLPEQLPVVFSGQRRLAHALITAAFLLANPAASIAAPALAPGAVAAAVTVASPAGASQEATSNRATTTPAGAAEQVSTFTIRVDGPGTFWDLAEHFLGDGQRWPEIWQLNDGRHQADGAVMTSPGLLRPGWTVVLPIDLQDEVAPADGLLTRVSAASSRTASEGCVAVAPGDSLWSISEAHLGDGSAWPHLFRLNQGKHQPDGGRLTDPDLIQPGWILTLPDPPATTTPPPPTNGPRVETPKPTIPGAGPEEPGSSAPITTLPTPASMQTPSRSLSSPEVSSSSAEVPPTVDGTTPADRSGSPPSAGVELSGGWVGLPLAAAVSGTAAMVWIRRRQRHRYQTEDPNLLADDLQGDDPYADDEDLQPLPAVVDRLRRTLRQLAPALLESAPPPPTVAEYITDPVRTPLPNVGPSGLQLAELHELTPAPGLGLIGPGAESAARALLVAMLTSGGRHDPDAQGALVIPATALRRLLSVEADQVKGLRRLRVANDLSEALAEVEAVQLHRQRLLDEHDAEDANALLIDPTTPPMPHMVLLADAPTEQQLSQRLTAFLDQGQSTNLSAVLLGEWPPGRTVHVSADGSTNDQHQSVRVAVLDQPTTASLIGVLTEAEPDHADETTATGEPDREVCEVLPADAQQEVPHAPVTAKVRVRIFGKVAVLDNQGQPIPGLRQNAGGLLVYLALHRKGADKSDILEAIWPDAPMRRAAERLSTEVGNLRRCIRNASPAGAAQPVLNTGGRYHLNPDVAEVDLWDFEETVNAASSASDATERERRLRDAVGWDTSVMTRGLDYHWLEPAREQLRRKAIRVHLQLAELVAVNDVERAAELTQDAAALDPTNEDLSRRAIDAHARAGNKAAVDAELRRLRSALRDIDEAPSQETLTLATSRQFGS